MMIRRIEQKDNHSFMIEWSDGKVDVFQLRHLQKACPCAACYDPASGTRLVKEEALDPGVRATKIESVGRYALRIDFTSGCRKGIYSFATLREIARRSVDEA
jgi:DUF971 family protein